MKKNATLLFIGLCLSLSSCNNDDNGGIELPPTPPSKYVSRVLEFVPAPGQFTNKLPLYTPGDGKQAMLDKLAAALVGKTGELISLGAYGGYLVVGFDHSIVNRPGANDFKVYGNAFENSAEPGIAMVSVDANSNGLADDEWYELAGSEHGLSTKAYTISYLRPNPANGPIPWFDSQGNSDTLRVVSGYNGPSYFPLWVDGDTLRFHGTLLPGNATFEDGRWKLKAYGWGYADSHPNSSAGCEFDIDWAVDARGSTVSLKKIDFIKIYTGVMQGVGALGETSTEVSGVEDLSME